MRQLYLERGPKVFFATHCKLGSVANILGPPGTGWSRIYVSHHLSVTSFTLGYYVFCAWCTDQLSSRCLVALEAMKLVHITIIGDVNLHMRVNRVGEFQTALTAPALPTSLGHSRLSRRPCPGQSEPQFHHPAHPPQLHRHLRRPHYLLLDLCLFIAPGQLPPLRLKTFFPPPVVTLAKDLCTFVSNSENIYARLRNKLDLHGDWQRFWISLVRMCTIVIFRRNIIVVCNVTLSYSLCAFSRK